MEFILSERSEKELRGVDSDLAGVVRLALIKSAVDFAVTDGLRTEDEQRELVAKGASQTMKSKHLIGEAVDLVPILNGKLRWEWKPIFAMALAMKDAGEERGVNLRWGGAWHRSLTGQELHPFKLQEEYVELRRSEGRVPFLDGPHFELV